MIVRLLIASAAVIGTVLLMAFAGAIGAYLSYLAVGFL